MSDIYKKQFDAILKTGEGNSRTITFIGSNEKEDRDGDTISLDGWVIDNYMKNPVVHYGHDWGAVPIARTKRIWKDKNLRALMFEIEFPTIEEISSNPDTPSEHALRVDAIYNMAKLGYINAVSVGFRGLEREAIYAEGSNQILGWYFTKQELMELSLVDIPANPDALAVMRSLKESGGAQKQTLDYIEKMLYNIQEDIDMEKKGGAKFSKETLAKFELIGKCFANMKAAHASMAAEHDEFDKCFKSIIEAPEQPDSASGDDNSPGNLVPEGNSPEKAYIVEIVG